MDFKAQLWLWGIVIVVVAVAGGPLLVVLGMFVGWLVPWLVAVALVLVFFAWLGRMLDRQDRS
ncbi:MAG: hypothetical protein ACRDZ7_07230 [Acidimicrobiia bacterium]